ncbi:MAG: hypothetical protein R3E53_21235 [Myxococcota bacterium]
MEISNDGSAVVSLHGDIAGDAISNLQSVGSVSGCSCYPAVGSGFVQVEMVLTQVGGVLRATGKMTGSNSADELPFEFAFPVGFDASTGFDLVMGNAGQDYEVVRVDIRCRSPSSGRDRRGGTLAGGTLAGRTSSSVLAMRVARARGERSASEAGAGAAGVRRRSVDEFRSL